MVHLVSVSHIHKKLKEEDIAVCECKYDACNPETACGETCLNVLTSTECTPGYCPCGEHCRNQKFQKCEYAKTKLFLTEGRGWGLLADQNMKAGQFIIEYCGEVISSEEAKQRSQTYEAQGLRDAYIISLNANYFIDATKKGSFARFINHSCEPNCETRKWTVLGETRVGIFAKIDISVGTELAYDYNFEWYGGVAVRCLCGAANCSVFLGAKSHGFQEINHVWEDGDARYIVENIPLYDSADDEPFPRSTTTVPVQLPFVPNDSAETKESVGSKIKLEPVTSTESKIKLEPVTSTESHYFGSAADMLGKSVVTIKKEDEFSYEDRKPVFSQTNAMISRIRSNTACRNYSIAPSPSSKKRSQPDMKQKTKTSRKKHVSSKPVAELFASKEARGNKTIRVLGVAMDLTVPVKLILVHEIRNKTTSELNSLYDEIRPAIEEHERDNQDSVATSVAEKWIQAACSKLKAQFDLNYAILKNSMLPRVARAEVAPSGHGEDNPPPGEMVASGPGEDNRQNEVKHLTD
ncbi:UNVERIFIED_CONTAM: Histone-lysine N-methyltransferase ASHH1 [Sesamum angustifolium]|uniref:Histone-lysine N-methyltransferase ASHH1 n=1 Tax=Sesamum angustifolium TaxID=2727405 RepID=A0AAW2LVE8_9LAMI